TVLGGSTNDLMEQMILRGPASIDATFVFENVAVDYIKEAQGRWGNVHFIYPEYNVWNENPFYVVGSSSMNKEKQKAVQALQDFLLTKTSQHQAVAHGFRSVDLSIPFLFPGSPFQEYAQLGLQTDIGTTCNLPDEPTVRALIDVWQH